MANTTQETKQAEVEAELKELQSTKRDADKRIKELKSVKISVQDVETWQKIQKLKDKMLKELKLIDGCKSWNLTKMMKTPTFFTYQNPNNTKEKASDDKAEWVVKYKKKNNSLAPLIEEAQKNHLKMVKKIFNRIKKRKHKDSDTDKPTLPVDDKKDARGLGVN